MSDIQQLLNTLCEEERTRTAQLERAVRPECATEGDLVPETNPKLNALRSGNQKFAALGFIMANMPATHKDGTPAKEIQDGVYPGHLRRWGVVVIGTYSSRQTALQYAARYRNACDIPNMSTIVIPVLASKPDVLPLDPLLSGDGSTVLDEVDMDCGDIVRAAKLEMEKRDKYLDQDNNRMQLLLGKAWNDLYRFETRSVAATVLNPDHYGQVSVKHVLDARRAKCLGLA